MAPTLKHVLNYRAILSKDGQLQLGATKGGAQRFVAPVGGGFLKGHDIDAELVGAAADWPSMDASTSMLYLDTRAQFRDRETGDAFCLKYNGFMKLDEQSQIAMQWSPESKMTKGGEHYWFTTPTFEVSAEKHKWMEQCWFVGQGHWYAPGDGTIGIDYEIYKMVPG